MKKIFLSALTAICSLAFVQCGHDDNNGVVAPPAATLFVNASAFTLGENVQGSSYNSLLKTVVFGETTLAFTMLDPSNNETLNITAQYEGAAPSDGLFPIFVDNNTFPTFFATGGYSVLAENVTFFCTGSGTVKVTDLGNDVYRLEFDNVVMEAQDSPEMTKTITGYAQAKFDVHNF